MPLHPTPQCPVSSCCPWLSKLSSSRPIALYMSLSLNLLSSAQFPFAQGGDRSWNKRIKILSWDNLLWELIVGNKAYLSSGKKNSIVILVGICQKPYFFFWCSRRDDRNHNSVVILRQTMSLSIHRTSSLFSIVPIVNFHLREWMQIFHILDPTQSHSWKEHQS